MRRAIESPILFFLFLLLISCTGSKLPPSDTLVVAIAAAPNSLDPRFATDANGMRMGDLLFNSLVRIGPDLKVMGDAAEKWKLTNNVVEFHLKPGLTFSNGRPLTKQDITFSIEQYQSEKCPFRSAFQDIVKTEVDQTKDGTFTVRLHLKSFSAKFLSSDLPVLRLLPKKEIEENPSGFASSPFGTGSFTLASQDSNQITFNGRPNHPFAPPKTQKIQFKVIRDDFTRFQKTYNGEIDIVQSDLPLDKVKSFAAKPKTFIVFRYPGLSFTYLLVNLEDPLLKNHTMRKALNLGINREEIIQYKLEGYGLPATSILTPNNPFFNHQLAAPPLDVKKAKSIITELAPKQTLTLKTSNNQAAVDVGKVLVNQFHQIGLNVELQSFEWGTFYGDVTKGNFQLATMKWVGAIDPDIYRVALHSQEVPPGRNRGKYKNKRLDRLMDDGLKIKDVEKRIDHYKLVQEIVMNDLPIIPLWYNQQVSIVNSRVKGYKPAMNGDFTPLLTAYKE